MDNTSTSTTASDSLTVLAEVAQSQSSQSSLPDLIGEQNGGADDKWGFGYLIGWFVGCTSCTLQILYAWLMRGFGIGMVGILIYRVLHLSLGCDSWHACYVINLVK